MSKKILTIDLSKWTTQTAKAASTIGGKSGKPVTVEYICKLVKSKKLHSWHIPELGITLVEK